MLEGLRARLTRRKHLGEQPKEGGLNRCLTTTDLTLLGVGSTLGVGVYVLAGDVARHTAGPSVVLSFLLAGAASALSGLCYAEFGARVPRAGSAYVYSYVTVGELAAFVIGWNLVLEYVIGTASVARGYSGYLDSLLGGSMKASFLSSMPMHAAFLASYPDWTAFTITLLLALLLSLGVKESTRFNNVFTLVNLAIVLFVTLAGLTQAHPANWALPANSSSCTSSPSSSSSSSRAGGFFPFGISGTLSGAATCFYGFVGFDAIATTGEETRDPQRSIPLAILVSLSLVSLAYTSVSSVLTLMLPYYLQDPMAPLPHVFHASGLDWAGTLVALGALAGLSTSLLGAMFPLPRVLYAMASDGVIPRGLAKVHPTFHTPLLATLLSGLLAAVMALLFDLSQLVDMMSIGTLMAYTMVGVCVLLLRYRDTARHSSVHYSPLSTADLNDSEEELFPCTSSSSPSSYTRREYARQCLNLDRLLEPTPLSSAVASHSTLSFTAFSFLFCLLAVHGAGTTLHRVSLVLTALKMILSLGILYLQPTDLSNIPFKVPLVPWLPATSILVNTFLTMKLSWQTWVRFSIWLTCGLLVYGCYGWSHSSEEYRMRGLSPPTERPEKEEKSSSKFDLDEFD